MDTNVWQEDRPIHVELTFVRASEASNLLDELSTWTPAGGWSENATLLFAVLNKAGNRGSQ